MPTITISDELHQALLAEATSPIDTPESIIRKCLSAWKHNQGKQKAQTARAQAPAPAGKGRSGERVGRGEQTPNQAYFAPIIEAVMEFGGSARAKAVLDRVEQKMKPELKAADYEPVGGGVPRWRRTAQWAARELRNPKKDLQYLRADGSQGVWELTSKGRIAAQTQSYH